MRGQRSLPAPIRSATFRFATPPRFHLLREPVARALLKALRPDNANTATAKTDWAAIPAAWRTGNIRAGDHTPARRTADKRPPHHGEMEHVNDIYGGVFADRLDPGSA